LPEEKLYLRELARTYMEYASLPVMQERVRLWTRHNKLEGERPIVVLDIDSFIDDVLPKGKCTTPAAVEIEKYLSTWIFNHEKFDDDKVIPPLYPVYMKFEYDEFGIKHRIDNAVDMNGRSLGYHVEQVIDVIASDMHKLKHSEFYYDREYTQAKLEFVSDILGEIMPVKLVNDNLMINLIPTKKVVHLMGQESMMISLLDEPDEFHKLMDFVTTDIVNHMKWQEENGLLTPNNSYELPIHTGNYGFTDELTPSDPPKLREMWINNNSQATICISPRMHEEFIFPYYYRISELAGLTYYGCCEPVQAIWDSCVSRIPRLRKVSISPWCDERIMGEALSDKKVIYSRKPSPNNIGLDSFNEEGLRESIRATLQYARDCKLEIIFRDIYTLKGDWTRGRKTVAITRELIDQMWQ